MGKRNKGANTKGQKRKEVAKKGSQAFSHPNFSVIDKKVELQQIQIVQ